MLRIYLIETIVLKYGVGEKEEIKTLNIEREIESTILDVTP